MVAVAGTDAPSTVLAACHTHEAACLGLARRILGNRALAEEVVQDVFLRLWRNPHRYQAERGMLRSFLLATVHHRAVDMVRAEQARRAREERYERSRESSSDAEDVSGIDRVLVQRALMTLTDAERTAIGLAYYRGMTYREVATFLDEPEGTIKSRIRVALQRLRAELFVQPSAR